MGQYEKQNEFEKGDNMFEKKNYYDYYASKYLGPRVRKGLESRWCKIGLINALGIPLVIVLILIVVVFVRASNIGLTPGTIEILNNAKTEGVNDGKEQMRAQRLAGAMKIQTVSYELGRQNDAAFPILHNFIRTSYPLIHRSSFIKYERVNNYSLLYTVTGTRPDKRPYMLCSHLDVVAANPATWSVDPYGGIIDNSYIYGRGALDDKGGVMGILEALEFMLSQNMRPLRTFYLAFGHDEEIGGSRGAREIANALKSRGVNKLDFILDEGFTVTRNLVPGPEIPVAFIGVSEKGILTLNLTVVGTPGHSSMPPPESALGILASAMAKIEKNKLPSQLGTGPETETFERIAPYSDFNHRVMYTNIWLFRDVLNSIFEKSVITNGFIRTTTALTIFRSGDKENVVPAVASAVVNHRVHPSQSVADVLEFITKTVNDPRVNIQVMRGREAPRTSPYGPNDLAYQLISSTILQTFDGICVAPGVMIANTDTLQYLDFTDNIYRFLPTVLEASDTARIHGNDERLSVAGFQNAVSFYYRFMRNADLVYDLAPSL